MTKHVRRVPLRTHRLRDSPAVYQAMLPQPRKAPLNTDAEEGVQKSLRSGWGVSQSGDNPRRTRRRRRRRLPGCILRNTPAVAAAAASPGRGQVVFDDIVTGTGGRRSACRFVPVAQSLQRQRATGVQVAGRGREDGKKKTSRREPGGCVLSHHRELFEASRHGAHLRRERGGFRTAMRQRAQRTGPCPRALPTFSGVEIEHRPWTP